MSDPKIIGDSSTPHTVLCAGPEECDSGVLMMGSKYRNLLVQVEINGDAVVHAEGRLVYSGGFFPMKTYSESRVDLIEIVPPHFRFVKLGTGTAMVMVLSRN